MPDPILHAVPLGRLHPRPNRTPVSTRAPLKSEIGLKLTLEEGDLPERGAEGREAGSISALGTARQSLWVSVTAGSLLLPGACNGQGTLQRGKQSLSAVSLLESRCGPCLIYIFVLIICMYIYIHSSTHLCTCVSITDNHRAHIFFLSRIPFKEWL